MPPDDLLPAERYTSPDIFARERQTIFADAWQILGRLDQLREPGRYLCANLAGASVFAVGDEAGAIGAFRNVCRHQKLPLLENGSGQCERLRCRYHGWTYDLTGAFVTAPPAAMPKEAAAPEHHLQRIAHAIWHGLVFVNPDPDAVAPDAMLNEAFGVAAPDPGDFAGEIALDLDCNWKLGIEQALARDARLVMVWPSLLVEGGKGRMVLHQIVPRSFQRTRIVSRLYLADGSDPAALRSAESDALALKSACDAAHERLKAGASPDNLSPTTTLAAFRARLRAGQINRTPVYRL